MARKKGLGRGLDALLTGKVEAQPTAGDKLQDIPLTQLVPSPFQPRREIAPEALEELAQSIRAQGVMQPIVVRAVDSGFEIIAGERRWRAAGLAGLKRIPAVVRAVDDTAAMAMALIENIQREELSPLEEAVALKRLIKECKLTHQQCADAVGRSRASVSNMLRLLELGEDVQQLMRTGQLEMGHARALLPLKSAAEQSRVAQRVAALALSVRQTEHMVRQLLDGGAGSGAAAATAIPNVRLHGLEAAFNRQLGLPASIRAGSKGGGQLVLRYQQLDELDALLKRLG